MFSTNGLARLVDLQHGAINEAKCSHQKWLRFQEDYKALKDRLSHLPDEVSYDYMVPFGPLAFMPGKLVHTNEILVLLGDNWFAEMSAKQACEVVDRRLEDVNEMLEKLQKQVELLESQRDFSAHALGETQAGLHDITEEYDSDQENEWREKHKVQTREHRKKERKAERRTDDDLLSRLDELQLQEMRGSEMSKLNEDSLKPLNRMNPDSRTTRMEGKMVRWEDDAQSHAPNLSIPIRGDSNDGTLDSDDSLPENVITFKHSPRDDSLSTTEPNSEPDPENIQSPADVYRLFNKPKSILKQPSGTSTPGSSTEQTAEGQNIKPIFQHTTAVSEHVKERSNPAEAESSPSPSSYPRESLPGSQSVFPEAKSSQRPSRPMSKFKQMKSKR